MYFLDTSPVLNIHQDSALYFSNTQHMRWSFWCDSCVYSAINTTAFLYKGFLTPAESSRSKRVPTVHKGALGVSQHHSKTKPNQMTSKLLPSEGTEAGRLPCSSATPSSSRSSRRPPGNAGRGVDAASWGRPPCSPQQTQLATGHLLQGQKPTSHSPGDKGHGHRHLANRARATHTAPPAPASKATPAHSLGSQPSTTHPLSASGSSRRRRQAQVPDEVNYPCFLSSPFSCKETSANPRTKELCKVHQKENIYGNCPFLHILHSNIL